MNFKKSTHENTVEEAIEKNDYRIRHANQMYALHLIGKTIKWSLIGVGLATVAGAVLKSNDTPEEEV